MKTGKGEEVAKLKNKKMIEIQRVSMAIVSSDQFVLCVPYRKRSSRRRRRKRGVAVGCKVAKYLV